jgi:hypothetical protein
MDKTIIQSIQLMMKVKLYKELLDPGKEGSEESKYNGVIGQQTDGIISYGESKDPDEKVSRLDSSLLSYMESLFDVDLKDVKIIRGKTAEEINKEFGSDAVTQGTNIYFKEQKFAPGTDEGLALLIHEMVHVVQSISGKVSHNTGEKTKNEQEAQETESLFLSQMMGKVFPGTFHEDLKDIMEPGSSLGHGQDETPQTRRQQPITGTTYQSFLKRQQGKPVTYQLSDGRVIKVTLADFKALVEQARKYIRQEIFEESDYGTTDEREAKRMQIFHWLMRSA